MRTIKYLTLFAVVLLVLAYTVSPINATNTNVIYLADGGNGDGSSFETPMGDFKEAVKTLSRSGGAIVICKKYTFNELLVLSDRSGSANAKPITVTSFYNETDYRQLNGAAFCVGDENMSANMILGGEFVFENLDIITSGSSTPRAIICNGNNVVFGEGINCKQEGNAPYISIIGGSVDEDITNEYSLNIKSGTYNNVCASNRNGKHKGTSSLIIDGGVFEGKVSATGFEGESSIQEGGATLTINGGTFKKSSGLLTSCLGKGQITINGGTFSGEFVCYATEATLDINGGDFQKINSIKIEDKIPKETMPETSEQTEKTDSDDEEKKALFVVNINQYAGDVKKLVGKVLGEGVQINTNTEGGVDVSTPDTPPQATEEKTETKPEQPLIEETNVQEQDEKTETVKRQYFFGSRNNTILAIIVLLALIASAAVLFAYRMVYRRKLKKSTVNV